MLAGMLTRDHLFVANIGDSRGYIYRNNEVFELSPRIHVATCEEEKVRIQNAGGTVVWLVFDSVAFTTSFLPCVNLLPLLPSLLPIPSVLFAQTSFFLLSSGRTSLFMSTLQCNSVILVYRSNVSLIPPQSLISFLAPLFSCLALFLFPIFLPLSYVCVCVCVCVFLCESCNDIF